MGEKIPIYRPNVIPGKYVSCWLQATLISCGVLGQYMFNRDHLVNLVNPSE